jgi:hypothetical protein
MTPSKSSNMDLNNIINWQDQFKAGSWT